MCDQDAARAFNVAIAGGVNVYDHAAARAFRGIRLLVEALLSEDTLRRVGWGLRACLARVPAPVDRRSPAPKG